MDKCGEPKISLSTLKKRYETYNLNPIISCVINSRNIHSW